LDPEDLRAVIGMYHKCVAETVDRFGGFVAKYMGDGVLAYFGYPRAHEHDAERADGFRCLGGRFRGATRIEWPAAAQSQKRLSEIALQNVWKSSPA